MWGLWPFAGEMEQEGDKFGRERGWGGGGVLVAVLKPLID